MKFPFFILFILLSELALTQPKDTIGETVVPDRIPTPKPEILSAGFIDIVQNGQMNASARLFRIFIGEPGKFQLPVSIYTGVSANSFTNPGEPGDILLALIDPGMGVMSISIDGNETLFGRKKKGTYLQAQYQACLRFVSMYNKYRYLNVNFLNFIYGAGLRFATRAWEKDKVTNMGQFWINLRVIYSKCPGPSLKEYFTNSVSSALWGYSAGMGIEISQALNVKIFYFRFINNQQIADFTQPYVQLSLNYSFR